MQWLKRFWFCYVRREHDWDRDIDTISDSTVFALVRCLRCDYAIDGAQAKRIKDHFRGMRYERTVERIL